MQESLSRGSAASGAMSGPEPGAYRVEDARELLITGLRNAHALEQQAIEMLERNAERLEHYPELKTRIRQHLTESRRQQEMVADALEGLGSSTSTVKDAVLGAAQNLQMMLHATASDEVLKNSFAGYAFEHYEIAAYKALIVLARAANEPRVERIAQEILHEEEAMAAWLGEMLPQVVSRHLVLMARGEGKR